MKPFHLMKGNELKPFTTCIYFKGGKAVVTNEHILLELPVSDVLGSDEVFNPELDYFIKLEDWKNAKADKATIFSYKEDTKMLHCIHKGGSVTYCPVQDASYLHYPDYSVVIPDLEDKKAIEQIGVDPDLLATLCKIWGVKKVRLTFFAQNKAIRVCSSEFEGVGVIMPLLFSGNHVFSNDSKPVENETTETVDETVDEDDDDI